MASRLLRTRKDE
jgi:hypothetical protein